MLRSLVYPVVWARPDLRLTRTPTGRAQAAEQLARRHAVRVLRRQATRTHARAADRLLVAAPRRRVPRAAWGRFPVRPETLLRVVMQG